MSFKRKRKRKRKKEKKREKKKRGKTERKQAVVTAAAATEKEKEEEKEEEEEKENLDFLFYFSFSFSFSFFYLSKGDHDYRVEGKKMENGRVTPTFEEDEGKVFLGSGEGDHQSLLASSLKATSLSLPNMISLSDPIWRKHSTI